MILYVLYQELDPINTQTIRTTYGEKPARVARVKPLVLRLAAKCGTSSFSCVKEADFSLLDMFFL